MPPGTEQPAEPRPAAPAPRVRPWLVLVLTIPAILLGAAVVVAVIVLPSMLRERVIEEARARGVELEVDDVSVWFGSLSLEDATFSFEGVRGVRGHAERVDVLLDGLRPARANVEGLDVTIEGTVAALIIDAEAWGRRHPPDPGMQALPVAATGVDVTWRSPDEEAPWLTVSGGNVSQSPSQTALSAPSATFAGTAIKDVGASWSNDAASLELALGSASPDDATLTVSVDRSARPLRATVTLAPTPVPKLVGPLAMPLPMDDVRVHGKAELVLPESPGTGPVTGHVEGTLDGFTPPHPIELGGFDFGKATTLSTDVKLSPTYDRLDLTETHVRAGEFRLKGDGRVLRHDGYATAELTLRGKLPCRTIARSAARARVGSVLGKVLGDAAHRVVDGSVAVTVDVTADSRKLDAPSVRPRIGIGCGLRPMSLEDLADLGLDSASDLAKGLGVPEDLVDSARETAERVSGKVAQLPSALPPLPSALTVPTLPKLPFEIREKQATDKQLDDESAPKQGASAPED